MSPRRRRRRGKVWPPPPSHPRSCVCRGTAMLPAEPFTAPNGRVYDSVSKPCPGIKKPAAPPVEPERQRLAAGEREDGQ